MGERRFNRWSMKRLQGRVPAAEGKLKQKSETLYDLAGTSSISLVLD